MTVVVLGIDALDPDIVDADRHPNLTLDAHRAIETITSKSGEPSTHELWPTIITGLPPAEHGIEFSDGVAWENTLLRYGSQLADYLLPSGLQTRIGDWLLNNTAEDAFRKPASYYEEHDISTVFDEHVSIPIGIPNYVIDPEEVDREHTLRRRLGTLFERDADATGGHVSSDPAKFYERCLEMVMVRMARARRGLRGGRHKLVFSYTSGLDLIGHVSYDRPSLQQQAYGEVDEFVGEVRTDLDTEDQLLLVSDHGLQDGVHTNEAMVAGTTPSLVDGIEGVLEVRGALERELATGDHEIERQSRGRISGNGADEITAQLRDLGYM